VRLARTSSAVAGVLGALPAVFRQQSVDQTVVGVELMAPMRVTLGAEQLRRADDVGEHHRGEHSLARLRRCAADEVEDRRCHRVVEEAVRARRQLPEFSIRDRRGKGGRGLDRGEFIAASAENKRRRADRLQRRMRSQQIRGPVPRSGDAEIPL